MTQDIYRTLYLFNLSITVGVYSLAIDVVQPEVER